MRQNPCHHWEALIVSTHSDDLLPEERANLHHHLLACSACRDAWDTDRQIDHSLRQDTLRHPSSDTMARPTTTASTPLAVDRSPA